MHHHSERHRQSILSCYEHFPLTRAENVKKWYTCLVFLGRDEEGLNEDSAAQCNQIRTIDVRERAIRKVGRISGAKMRDIEAALRIHLSL